MNVGCVTIGRGLLTGCASMLLCLGLAAAPVWPAARPEPQSSPAAAAPAAAPPDAVPERLTLEQAIRAGLERNPQIAASLAGVASAEANYRSLAAFPSLNLGVTSVAGTSTAPTLTGATSDTFVDFGETLDTSGQRRLQAAAARAQLAAARYQYEETKLTLTQQIRDAYWSLVAAREQARLAQEGLRDAQRVYQLTRTQNEAGASPRVDVIRSSIDLANVQQNSIAVEGGERAALSAFNVLLARPPFAPVEPADAFTDATATTVAAADPPGLEELTQAALVRRPLVKSAREQVRAADYALKQARAARRPDISVDYQRSVRQSFDTLVVAAHLPLLDFGSIRNSVRSAEQSKRQAEAQEQQAEQQVRQQVAQAYTDFTQAQRLARSFQTAILSPSVTLLSTAQLGYQQGATGILPVIDAETTLRNARTGSINSLLALYKAQDELDAATGGPASPAAASPKQ